MDKDNANTPGGGITHTTTPITMDIVVDDTVSTPSTLTINSVTGGTGTDLASTNFRTKSVNLNVAEEIAVGYRLMTDKATLNYAIAATSNILAGTYRAELVYTVTGV